MKLAEALLCRKELAAKVELLKQIKNIPNVFERKVARKQVSDSIDDIIADVPKLTASQVTAELDFYSRQLRTIDAAIQQANWQTDLPETQVDVMADYKPAEVTKAS